MLHLLKKVGLKCNLKKSFLCQEQVEYLGYLLTRDGIKPTPGKVKPILDLAPPTNVRGVRRVLGIIQYYRDLWNKRSHILAPLTSLVGECGKNKNSKTKAKNMDKNILLKSLVHDQTESRTPSCRLGPRWQEFCFRFGRQRMAAWQPSLKMFSPLFFAFGAVSLVKVFALVFFSFL